MKIHRHIKPLKQQPHLLIGNFDGVHLGHQALIQQAKHLAKQDHAPIACMLFQPHPKLFFKQPHITIQTPYDQWMTLKAYGITDLFILKFNSQLANMTHDAFISNILLPLNPKSIHIGADFKFGFQRSGTIEHLKTYFNVYAHPLVYDQTQYKYASRIIRTLLQEGSLDHVAAQLGRPFHISGIVQSGQRLGRQLGYPTANLHATNHPLAGIYYGTTLLPDQRRIPSAISIGHRPYQPTEHGLLETHLLDFDEDLYGQRLHVIFHKKLRNQIAFTQMADLVQQMEIDIQNIRKLMEHSTI